MITQLVIGSNNAGKVAQCKEYLGDLPIELLCPYDLGIVADIQETGTTYTENATLKAEYFYKASGGIPTIADDSGIEVESLVGELGVKSRRWGAGPYVSDAEWIAHFLDRMQKESNKNARFISTICYKDASGDIHFFTASVEGTITDSIEADYKPGLPISGCFKPLGESLVYSALENTNADWNNHRKRAILEFKEFLY